MRNVLILITSALLLVGLGTTTARADSWVLWDWSANIDGTTFNPPGLPPSVNSAGFDFNTGLGSLTFSFDTPGAHYAGVYLYLFYDGGFGDVSDAYGTVNGVPPTGLSFELRWPGADGGIPTVFDNFAANSLDNANHVAAYSPPPTACCSIAVAELFGFNLDPGAVGTLSFLVSPNAPRDGFYLQLTDHDSGENLYLTESFASSSITTPEPGSLFLLASGMTALLGLRRRSAEKK